MAHHFRDKALDVTKDTKKAVVIETIFPLDCFEALLIAPVSGSPLLFSSEERTHEQSTRKFLWSDIPKILSKEKPSLRFYQLAQLSLCGE